MCKNILNASFKEVIIKIVRLFFYPLHIDKKIYWILKNNKLTIQKLNKKQ